MNKILLVSLLCCVSLATFAQDGSASGLYKNKAPASDTVKISLKPEIVGLWKMPIASNKSCTEYYNFQSNNKLVVNSGAEWSTGFYEYQADQEVDNKQGVLAMSIQYDNNQEDCSGNRVDQSGEVSQYLLKWRDAQSFELCNTEQANQCFATLSRVLP